MKDLTGHFLCSIAVLCCFLFVVPVAAKELTYQEQKGKEITLVSVKRETQGALMRSEIVKNDVTEISFSAVTGTGATSRWERQAPPDKSYTASREANILTITGKAEGEPHENAAGLDGNPWFQDLGYSLAKFAKTAPRDLTFWNIKEGELEPTTLTAKKRGSETLTINGQSIAAKKIEVSESGFFTKLWTGFYWFRESDGLLVQYKSDPGIPGMSETVGTLQAEQTEK